jgi:hypothetical protein
MLKKEEEKPLPDYKIKEILSYGDKVKESAEGDHIKSTDDAKEGQFNEIKIEETKLEDIEGDTPKPKKKHHEE